MKVFVTNMPYSKDRRKSIVEQMEGQGVDYSFFDCVVGADLTNEDLERLCDMGKINKHNEKLVWFNKGIIGCTLTCHNVYRKIIDDNLPYALYMEDDARLPKNLKAILDHIETFIQQGDVVMLFWRAWEPVRFSKNSIPTPFGFSYRSTDAKTIFGGTCQVITNQAARKMLELNTPVHITPDCWHYFIDSKAISRFLVAVKPCVGVVYFKSTMRAGKFLKLRDIISNYALFSPIRALIVYFKNRKVKKHQRFTIES